MIIIDTFGNASHQIYFGFHLGSIYVFRGDDYDDNNVVKSSLYQESFKSSWGPLGHKPYRIVGDNLI